MPKVFILENFWHQLILQTIIYQIFVKIFGKLCFKTYAKHLLKYKFPQLSAT